MKAESQKRCLKPGHVQSREFLKFLKPAREAPWPPGSETARTRAIPDAPNKSYEFCVGERLLISYNPSHNRLGTTPFACKENLFKISIDKLMQSRLPPRKSGTLDFSAKPQPRENQISYILASGFCFEKLQPFRCSLALL